MHQRLDHWSGYHLILSSIFSLFWIAPKNGPIIRGNQFQLGDNIHWGNVLFWLNLRAHARLRRNTQKNSMDFLWRSSHAIGGWTSLFVNGRWHRSSEGKKRRGFGNLFHHGEPNCVFEILRVIVDQNSDRFASDFEVSRSEKNTFLRSGSHKLQKRTKTKSDHTPFQVVIQVHTSHTQVKDHIKRNSPTNSTTFQILGIQYSILSSDWSETMAPNIRPNLLYENDDVEKIHTFEKQGTISSDKKSSHSMASFPRSVLVFNSWFFFHPFVHYSKIIVDDRLPDNSYSLCQRHQGSIQNRQQSQIQPNSSLLPSRWYGPQGIEARMCGGWMWRV